MTCAAGTTEGGLNSMMIDSTELIQKLPAMLQGRKTFAKMSDGGNYHVGKPDNWCLHFNEVVTAIEDFCDYKRTGRFSLSAPIDGNWDVMNAYPYKKGEQSARTEVQDAP